MVVDDIRGGTRPLLVTDYIACRHDVPERIADIVRSVRPAPPSAAGRGTAEHPGLMAPTRVRRRRGRHRRRGRSCSAPRRYANVLVAGLLRLRTPTATPGAASSSTPAGAWSAGPRVQPHPGPAPHPCAWPWNPLMAAPGPIHISTSPVGLAIISLGSCRTGSSPTSTAPPGRCRGLLHRAPRLRLGT